MLITQGILLAILSRAQRHLRPYLFAQQQNRSENDCNRNSQSNTLAQSIYIAECSAETWRYSFKLRLECFPKMSFHAQTPSLNCEFKAIVRGAYLVLSKNHLTLTEPKLCSPTPSLENQYKIDETSFFPLKLYNHIFLNIKIF